MTDPVKLVVFTGHCHKSTLRSKIKVQYNTMKSCGNNHYAGKKDRLLFTIAYSCNDDRWAELKITLIAFILSLRQRSQVAGNRLSVDSITSGIVMISRKTSVIANPVSFETTWQQYRPKRVRFSLLSRSLCDNLRKPNPFPVLKSHVVTS